MSTNPNIAAVEAFAKSPGESVSSILKQDLIPPPRQFTEPSYEFLGDDDISVERYYQQEWHDREIEKVWKKVWQVACREEDIPDAGDYIVYDIGDDSVLVARQPNGSVKAYVNACLHRGNQLCVGKGKTKAFRCPFHGFTWSLEGKLRWIPGEWDFPHVDKQEFSLPEINVGQWGGFVFINLDPECDSLQEYLELLPAHLDGDELANRYKAAHVSQVINCNWKLLQEAFIEGYHVAETHFQKDEDGWPDPNGLAVVSHDTATQYDIWPGVQHIDRLMQCTGVPSQYVAHRVQDEQQVVDYLLRRIPAAQRPKIGPGERARPALAEFNRKALGALHGIDLSSAPDMMVLDQVQYNVFPNFTIWPTVAAPLIYRFRPYGNDPNKSLFEVWFLFPRPDDGSPRPVMQDLRLPQGQLWASVEQLGVYGPIIDQDIPNLERLQIGVKAMRKPGITLGNYQECRIRRFHKVLEEYLAR